MSDDVRSDTLRCHKCNEWLPDVEFYHMECRRRRDKHYQCKACFRLYRVERNNIGSFEKLFQKMTGRL